MGSQRTTGLCSVQRGWLCHWDGVLELYDERSYDELEEIRLLGVEDQRGSDYSRSWIVSGSLVGRAKRVPLREDSRQRSLTKPRGASPSPRQTMSQLAGNDLPSLSCCSLVLSSEMPCADGCNGLTRCKSDRTWDRKFLACDLQSAVCGKRSMDRTLLSMKSVVGSLLLQGFLARSATIHASENWVPFRIRPSWLIAK